MPCVKHCCFCASLSMGGAIIGWVNLIIALFEIIGFAFSMSLLDSARQMLSKMDRIHRNIAEMLPSFGILVLSIILIVKVIGFICAILLILGATKRKRWYILPYLIFESVYFFLIIIIWFTLVVLLSDSEDVLYGLIVCTILAVINVYLWICVLSLYQEIRDEESRPPGDTYLMRPTGGQIQIQSKQPAYATQQNLL